MVDPILLEEQIEKSGKKKSYLSDKCGCSIQALRLKIKGEYDFTNTQTDILCSELGITSLTMKEKIFFKKQTDCLQTDCEIKRNRLSNEQTISEVNVAIRLQCTNVLYHFFRRNGRRPICSKNFSRFIIFVFSSYLPRFFTSLSG